MTEVLELTILRPAHDDLSGADFIDANSDIDAHLRRQPGFRWRRIVQRDDDTIDHPAVDWQMTTVLQLMEGAQS